MKNNKGFTLIELLVVIAIIGILSSVVLASLSSARTKANVAAFKGEASSLRSTGVMACDGATNGAAITLPTFSAMTVTGNTCTGDGTFTMVATPKNSAVAAAGLCGATTNVTENGPAFSSTCK